jgi:MFS family permease
LQGIGGALMIPGSLSLISSSIDEKERGKAIGTWSAFTTVVTMGGPVLGGALADAGLWRYIFFINAPIGIVALVILSGKVQESRETSSRSLDIPGAITIALGLALVTFGCLRIPALGLKHVEVLGSLAGGVVLMTAFVVIEKKSREPMMPLGLFANRNFSGANLLTFFLYAGLGSGLLFLGLNMVQVQGYSQLQSGLSFLPFTLLMISITRKAGALADRLGPRLLLIAGPTLAGAGLLWLSFIGMTNGPSEYWTTYFPGMIVFGLGMSMTVSPLTATVMGSVNEQYSGTASGINNALTRVANVFANAILGALAVLIFSGSVDKGIEGMGLNGNEREAVVRQSADLGNAKAPDKLDKEKKEKVAKIFKEGFVDVYQMMMKISAVLAWLGAAAAFFMITRR